MELSLLRIVAAMGVVGLGAIVQGTIGFGMAVVAAPFLYQIDPVLVPGATDFFRYGDRCPFRQTLCQ